MSARRYLSIPVEEDLLEKMVFVGGPRQVGKTTFALSLLAGDTGEQSPAYLNWDALNDREASLAGRIPSGEPRVILDEIHKFVVLRDGRPEFAVECKSGERHVAPACAYFRERTDIPRFPRRRIPSHAKTSR